MVFDSDIDVSTIAAGDYTVDATGTVASTGTSVGGTVFNDQTFTVSDITGDGTIGVSITTTGIWAETQSLAKSARLLERFKLM